MNYIPCLTADSIPPIPVRVIIIDAYTGFLHVYSINHICFNTKHVDVYSFIVFVHVDALVQYRVYRLVKGIKYDSYIHVHVVQQCQSLKLRKFNRIDNSAVLVDPTHYLL